ncbi:MAG: putative lipid II flippase FtsW [Thiotrichales bacterium]|nr:MAG: putative lipid II flippase FtsW [Thiotrichales bacterium]
MFNQPPNPYNTTTLFRRSSGPGIFDIKLDGYIIFSLLSLMAIGILMVASASMPITHNSLGIVLKQSVYVLLSVFAVGAAIFIPLELWSKLTGFWLVCGLVLLVLVLIPGIGHEVNGSRRWIKIAFVTVQVSELIKLCGIMYVASYLVRHQDTYNSFLGIIRPLAVLSVMAVLLLLEPDFGASVVLFASCLGIMFMAKVRIRWFVMILLPLVAMVCLLVFFSPYRLARLMGFLHPWQHRLDSGYQLTQALLAFVRGGIFGVGLGDSLQKLFYLPEAHTDFILSIIAEELGVVGVCGVLGLFILFFWRGMYIAKQAMEHSRNFSAYLAYGIVFWIILQMLVNFGVNLGLLPTKGLTLPFVSYGGSSLLINSFAVGILLKIDLLNKMESLHAKRKY